MNKGALKAIGAIMVIFAIIYALVGALALCGVLSNVLPGHERQEILIVALGYAVALLSLICGIVCIKGAAGAAKFFGLIFVILSLASLLYQQFAHDTFSIVDCFAMCFGVIIYSTAKSIQKNI